MSIFAPTGEVEKTNIVPNRWVRFTRGWDWDLPSRKGRYTKHFPAGTQILLTRHQFQSAMAAGVAVSIPNPRHVEITDGGPSDLGCDP